VTFEESALVYRYAATLDADAAMASQYSGRWRFSFELGIPATFSVTSPKGDVFRGPWNNLYGSDAGTSKLAFRNEASGLVGTLEGDWDVITPQRRQGGPALDATLRLQDADGTVLLDTRISLVDDSRGLP